jgi:nicotinate dehydrogenase subunit B
MIARASADLSRSNFLKSTGLLVVTFGTPAGAAIANTTAALGAGDVFPYVDPSKLDSWLAVGSDGRVTVFTGRTDYGQHKSTAYAQIVADELDVPFSAVTMVMGDTARTVNQGASTASDGMLNGAKPLRHAAAEARLALINIAVQRMNVPADRLTVTDGIVSIIDAPDRKLSYAQLIGSQRFDIALQVTKPDSVLVDVAGKAKLKDPATYRVVGRSVPSIDIPPKVRGTWPRVHNQRVAGMLHARLILPPSPGAHVVRVGKLPAESKNVHVVSTGDFVAVVAATEWAAIRAAGTLPVTWSHAETLPTNAGIFQYLRTATPLLPEQAVLNNGNVDAGLAGAAKTFTAEYNYPVQTHGMIGPSCAVADVNAERVLIYAGTQDAPATRASAAKLLGVPVGIVRVFPLEPSGAYGRLGIDDAAVAAAYLSQQLGKPVRVQLMRNQEHTWAPLQPPSTFTLRAGVDSTGKMVAWDHHEWTWSFVGDELPVMLIPKGSITAKSAPLFRPPGGGEIPAYHFGSLRVTGHTAPPLLRGLFMRSPGRIQVNFAGEQFIDEIAAGTGQDPIAFRLRHATDERLTAVLDAAEKSAGWQRRTSPGPDAHSTARIAAGRGISVVASQRSTYIATVAEVQVDRKTGVVTVKRMIVAADPGIVVNPIAIRAQIEGATIFATSRALKEEVKYDRSKLTTVDWETYPILRFTEIPEIEIALINRVDLPPGGIGEPPNTTPAAAIGNAIFDAIGVRIRQAPFTPDRIKAALVPTSVG